MLKKIEKIERFLLTEAEKRGFSKVVFGLSGGIDSAVVGYFCNKVFKNNAMAVIMPSNFSNPSNINDAINFAKTINLNYELVHIGAIQDCFSSIIKFDNTSSSLHRIGNLCARIRMSILYDKSFLYNSLVVGTSNKSELMLGYGTLYGDLSCAINPIGNIFKSDIFKIAELINIPRYIIDKKPSADLYYGQSDEDDLGYSYEDIDKLLFHIDKGINKHQLLEYGFEEDFVFNILNRIQKNSFKRYMPAIAEI